RLPIVDRRISSRAPQRIERRRGRRGADQEIFQLLALDHGRARIGRKLGLDGGVDLGRRGQGGLFVERRPLLVRFGSGRLGRRGRRCGGGPFHELEHVREVAGLASRLGGGAVGRSRAGRGGGRSWRRQHRARERVVHVSRQLTLLQKPELAQLGCVL